MAIYDSDLFKQLVNLIKLSISRYNIYKPRAIVGLGCGTRQRQGPLGEGIAKERSIRVLNYSGACLVSGSRQPRGMFITGEA